MFHSADIGNGRFYLGDCLEVMPTIPDGVVDLVLCDLPYGTTQNKWDSILPWSELWDEYDRLCKDAVVLSAAQPFTSKVVISNIEAFRYSWTWVKSKATGHLNAKKQPLRATEDILVFGGNVYNPQGLIKKGKPTVRKGRAGNGSNYGDSAKDALQTHENYPKNIIDCPSENGFHPTQKPVALWEYLIRTYTNEGDVVLDNCAGSGTTAIACENTGRRWVCIEKEEKYAVAALERIKAHLAAK